MNIEFRIWHDDYMIRVEEHLYIAFFHGKNKVDWALYDDTVCIYKHDSLYPQYETTVLMERSPWNCIDEVPIFEGDILELENDAGMMVRVVCEKGKAIRDLSGVMCEINGWYFRCIATDKKTFPIVDNYLNAHDVTMMKVIGNIHANPNLLNKDMKSWQK